MSMPITKVEFHTAVEERVKELMREMQAFLSENKELAYSEKELVAALGLSSDVDSQTAFREALRALDGLEALRWGFIDGEEYYIYNQDLGGV